jgi:hypothetical protein
VRFELSELLEWAQSPERVRRWARTEPGFDASVDDVEDPMAYLERTPGGEHAVWLAAILTLPLDLVAAAVAVAIETDAAALGDPLALEACALAVEALTGTDDPASLLVIAERCESRRARDEAGYRGTDPRHEQVLAAAGALCRAVEALASARVRIDFELRARAQARVSILGAASIIGVGANAVLGDREPPFALGRPALGEAPVPHDLRAAVGLLGDALAVLGAADERRVRDAFLDALASE